MLRGWRSAEAGADAPSEAAPPAGAAGCETRAPGRGDAVSPEGRLRLLGIVGTRVSAEIAGLVVPPVLLLVYGQGPALVPLLAWAAVYWSVSAIVFRLRRRFRAEMSARAAEDVVARWMPRFRRASIGYGLAWSCVVLAAWRSPAFEFDILVYGILAAANASAVAFTAAVWPIFLRFLASSWGVATLAVPWAFPAQWPWMLPVCVLYAALLVRHGRSTHRFLVEQVVLEERAAELARQHREASERAERALQDKSRFLATASHDLRQPVYALGLLTDALASRNRDPALEPALRDLRACARTIDLMFESLMDLSRLEAAALVPSIRPCALAPLLEELHAQFRPDAEARGLQWRLRLPARAAVVQADPLLLRRAVSNLIHNALRYTPEGAVLLALRRRGSEWRIEVWDTGVGVADDAQSALYAPFYRSTHAWTMDSAGHGLGLAVFAECVRLLRARSGLASRLGRGSCFWMALPEAQAQLLPEQGPPGTPAPARRLSGRCLVIDDDPMVRRALAAWMETRGIDARLVADGTQAFAVVAQGFEPEVVLCDQRLRSGESGFELLEALLARLPGARGAMMSGELEASELRSAEEEGYLVLRKPVDPVTLEAVLGHWLAGGAVGIEGGSLASRGNPAAGPPPARTRMGGQAARDAASDRDTAMHEPPAA